MSGPFVSLLLRDLKLAARSGGGAALVEKRLNAQVMVVDNLVLEGLLQIALQPGAGQRLNGRP